MTRFNSEYTIKNTPSPNDRVWGLDFDGGSNAGFELKKILQLGDFINVKDFGAVGSGLVDDRDAINQAATFAASAAKTLYFPSGTYFVSNSVNLPAGTRIHGYGAKIFNLGSHIYLINVNGNTIIKGLEIEGAGAETPNDLGRGINMVGTVGDYKSGLTLEDVYVHDVGFYGIYLQFVENCKIIRPKVINSGYSGIMHLSCSNIDIEKPWVKGITCVGGQGYNISFTRGSTVSGDNLMDNPRSYNCTVKGGLIQDNLHWKGLDTHAGDSITFEGIFISNCAIPVGIVPGNMPFAPKNCKVINNFIHSGLGLNAGILLSGVINSDNLANSIDLCENTQIIGNIFVECGLNENNFSGAIRMRDTQNTAIIGNHFVRSLINDIGVQNTNWNFTITSNTFQDVNAPSGFLARGINVTNPHNRGYIGENTFDRKTPELNVNVGDRTIRLDPSHVADMSITIGGNQNNGFLSDSIEDGTNITKIITNKGGTFNGIVTIARTLGSANEQLRFDHLYRFWADNVGPGSHNSRLWLSGPAGGAFYFGVRSGDPIHYMQLAATSIDLVGAIRAIGPFRSEGEQSSISGAANSGNSLPVGMQGYSVSSGLANNYPADLGTVFRMKISNQRTWEIFLNTTSDIWVRSLHTSDSNTWKRLRSAEGFSQTITTSGTINNLAISSTTDHLILTNAIQLTGIIAGQEGRELIIENRNSVPLEIAADSGSSDAANRTAFTFTLPSGEMIKIKYANNKWRRVN